MVKLVFGSFRNMENIHLTRMTDGFEVNTHLNYYLGQINNHESLPKKQLSEKLG